MEYLLRKITKPRWYGPESNETLTWLPEGCLQADALSDLPTKGNKLSVWQVKADLSNLDDVILALAANCKNISKIDYALVEVSPAFSEQFRVEEAPGETPFALAAAYHRNLCELSAEALLQVARVVQRARRERYPERKVCALLITSLKDGRLDIETLHEDLRRKLEPTLSK